MSNNTAQTWQQKTNGWLHDENNIKGFFGDYRWLSNFHQCFCKYEGFIYFSSEGAYQAAKTTNEIDKVKFISAKPSEAKRLGRLIKPIRSDWDEIKVYIMGRILLDKFTRNEDLKLALIGTGKKYLEETNWWNDKFWGVCNGIGKNNLGKILMKIRDELK